MLVKKIARLDRGHMAEVMNTNLVPFLEAAVSLRRFCSGGGGGGARYFSLHPHHCYCLLLWYLLLLLMVFILVLFDI